MTTPAATVPPATLDAVLAEVQSLRAEIAAQPRSWPPWMSIKVASDYMSLSSKSVRRLVARGDLKPRRILRGKLLLCKKEIDGLMK